MRIPLDLNLLQFLLDHGYEYWLAKTQYTDDENTTTLIPVHKPIYGGLPEGYTYYKLTSQVSKTLSEGHKIIVHLIEEDIFKYKKFLIERFDSKKSQELSSI
jgi:hypothetical protein